MPKNEVTLDKENEFITQYGSSFETEYPSVFYLRTKSKITPIVKQKDYEREIVSVKRKFSEYVNKAICECKTVGNDYLFNIDISSKSVKHGKVSFLRYDLYLKPTKRKTLDENRYRVTQLSRKLDKQLKHLLESNNIRCQ